MTTKPNNAAATDSANRSAAQFLRWQKVWQNNLPEIDRVICSAANGADTLPDLAQIEHKVEYWFDQQTFDPPTREEWDEVKQQRDVFEAKLRQRVSALQEQGKLGQLQLMQAGAAQSGGASAAQISPDPASKPTATGRGFSTDDASETAGTPPHAGRTNE